MRRLYAIFLLLLATFVYTVAQEVVPDSIGSETPCLEDSIETKSKTLNISQRVVGFLSDNLKEFNESDTVYIEPQHYDFCAMMQNTNTYELYRLSTQSGQSILFAPKPTYRVGPYFGWRWLFLGYTFDISHLSNESNKKEFDLSIYSNLISIDLYYRKTGTDYLIREIDFNDKRIGRRRLHNVPFDGLNVGITGVNVHYIFNHKKFSYPAAFSQSTVQRRSCGSALAGVGNTRHSIKLDYDRLKDVLTGIMPELSDGIGEVQLDSGLTFNNVRYTDISLSGGYAYNWVPARNWLVAASLSLALGYKYSSGKLLKDEDTILTNFSFKNVALDGTGRFGIVWNNTKWFAGMSAIVHSYSYKKRQFSADNFFGSLNFYVGFNFCRKKNEK